MSLERATAAQKNYAEMLPEILKRTPVGEKGPGLNAGVYKPLMHYGRDPANYSVEGVWSTLKSFNTPDVQEAFREVGSVQRDNYSSVIARAWDTLKTGNIIPEYQKDMSTKFSTLPVTWGEIIQPTPSKLGGIEFVIKQGTYSAEQAGEINAAVANLNRGFGPGGLGRIIEGQRRFSLINEHDDGIVSNASDRAEFTKQMLPEIFK